MKSFRRSAEVLLLVAAGCSPTRTPAPAPPPPPVAEPLSESAIGAIAELLRMEDRLVLDATRITAIAGAPEPEVRARAALAAGRVGGAGALPVLLALLSDTTAHVRIHAALGLALVRDSSVTAVDSLAAVILHGAADRPTAHQAVFALGRTGSHRAREVVRTLLDAPVERAIDPALTAEALLVSWRFERDAGLVDAVVRHAASVPPNVRARAVYSLMRMGAPAGIPVLLEALADADPYIRSLAARGLAPGPVDSAGRRREAMTGLLAALTDPHPHVRINAATATGRYGDASAVPTLIRLLTADEPAVGVAAAGALGTLGENNESGAALEAVARDATRRAGLRAAALTALVRASPRAALRVATEWADSASWLARMHAARALGGLPWSGAEAPLRALARDPDGRVAAAALASARTAADTADPARAFFVDGLAHLDPDARAAALRGLAAAADPADFALLMEAYERAQEDHRPDAALAAIDALAALGRTGLPVARAFQLRFPRHPDVAVQVRARARLGDGVWGAPDSVEHDRGSQYYENLVRSLVAPAVAGGSLPQVDIHTRGGAIRIELAAADAPRTVQNFLELIRAGYFEPDGDPERARWHRVVPNFVLQDGDSRGDGSGGPGHTIRDEVNLLRYSRGMVGMAHAGPHTAGGQFFITHSPQPHLDGAYTIFGRVVSGMDVADGIVQDDLIEGITIVS